MDPENIFKAVFILDIDQCLSHETKPHDVEQTVQCMKFTTIKILTSFTQFKRTLTNMQWSYFILTTNSDKNLRRILSKRLKFKDLSIDSLSEFEQTLDMFLSPGVLKHQEDDILNPLAKQLRNSINTVVMDLQWTPPSIMSPLKGGRLRNFGASSNTNNVFILTVFPNSIDDLVKFSSLEYIKSSSAEEEVRQAVDEMLPLTLLSSIKEKIISIHFIDLVQVTHKSEETNIPIQMGSVYKLFVDEISKLQAYVLPINALLTLRPNPCNRLAEKEDISHLKADPGIFPTNPKSFSYETTSGSPYNTLPCSGKLVMPHEKVVEIEICLSKPSSNDSLPSAKQNSNQLVLLGETLSASLPVDFSNVADASNTISFKVIGSVARDQVSFDTMEMSDSFLVKPLSDTAEYMKFLRETQERNISQIIEVDVNGCVLFHGFLETLSDLVAIVRIFSISIGNSHSLNKLLLVSKSLATTEEQSSNSQTLNEFISKSVEHISQQKVQSESQSCAYSEGSIDDMASFDPAILKASCQPGTTGLPHKHWLPEEEEHEKEVREFELRLLRKLQKKYIAEKAVRMTDVPKPASSKTPRKTLKALRRNSSAQLRRSPRKDTPSVTLPPRLPVVKGRTHTAPTRADQLWATYRRQLRRSDSNSRLTAQGQDAESSSNVARTTESKADTVAANIVDLDTEEDLSEFLRRHYEDTMTCELSVAGGVQTLVNSSVHFYRSKQHNNPQNKAFEIVGPLTLSAKEIKAKHSESEDTEQLFKEYELQLLLLSELETLVAAERSEEEAEQAAAQVSGILRAISFMKDPDFVPRYMKETMLKSYADTAPLFLSKVYDELLLPLPAQLESFLSPEALASVKSATQLLSVASSAASANSNMLPPSNQPTHRDKPLNRYRSFHAGPTRQISVVRPAATSKERKPRSDKPRRTSARIASSTKKSAKKRAQAAKVDDSKKVRKNLFGVGSAPGAEDRKVKLERRQSCVAALPSQSNSARQQRTPKRSQKSKARVADTPAHKQCDKAVWRRQERRRQRTQTGDPDTVHIVEESPDKQAQDADKRTLKKVYSKLMKNRSFYSDNVVRTEKLEARMVTAKILSPTWNAPKFGSLLQKTPPRRITPRMLFKRLETPSPKKSAEPEAGTKSPFENGEECFSLKKAVTRLNFMQSPCKGTRLQQANMKPFADFAGNKFERLFTPGGKNILKTPVKDNTNIPLPKTPTSTRRMAFDHVRESDSVSASGGVGRRVSFNTTLLTPQKQRFEPCHTFQSPSKSILTPKKFSQRLNTTSHREHVSIESQENCVVAESPLKEMTALKTPSKSPRRKAFGESPVRLLSSGLDSSSSGGSAERSAPTTRNILTRSASKQLLHGQELGPGATGDVKVRANLSALFDASQPHPDWTAQPQALPGGQRAANSSRVVLRETTTTNIERQDSANESDFVLKRRALRAKARSVGGLRIDKTRLNSFTTSQAGGVKRKPSGEDQNDDTMSRKQSCSRVSVESMQSLHSLMDVNISDHNEVFMDDSAMGKSRCLEGITRSSLLSDNSNSALSFAEFTELAKLHNLENQPIGKGHMQQLKNNHLERVMSIDAEESNSPIFQPATIVPIKLLRMEAASDSSGPPSPCIQNSTLQTITTNMKITANSISLNADAHCEDNGEEGANPVVKTPSRFANGSNTVASASKRRVLSSPTAAGRVYSPLSAMGLLQLTESLMHNEKPRKSPSQSTALQSPGVTTRMRSPPANKYSPLSNAGLYQLTQSPIVDPAANNMSPSGSRKVRNNKRESMEGEGLQKRPTRRSLYGTETNSGFAK